MADTSIRIPNALAEKLDTIVEQDPQWKTRSSLALNVLWEWVKDQEAKRGE
jgi:predicted transcriptional regulator